MKKRILFLFVAAIGMALQGTAQEAFTVKVPPFRKFVKITASDVNLRQAPSAQSPRLVMRSEENEIGDVFDNLVWSNRPIARNEKVIHAKVLPVWESTILPTVKDSKDWICGHHEGKMVYVMRKFCKEVSLRPLSLPAPKLPGFRDFIKIESGKYKDYCIAICQNMIDEQYFRLGKYVNGMFIFNYTVYSELMFSKDLSSDGSLDLKKLIKNEQALDTLMNMDFDISRNYNPIIFYGVIGDNNWYSITDIY